MNRTEHEALHPYANQYQLPIEVEHPDGAKVVPTVLASLASSGSLAAFRVVEISVSNRKAWLTDFYRMTGDFNLHLTLSALNEADPDKAEEIARLILSAYQAGDSYGEWLWEWASSAGVDTQKVIDEAQACPVCRVEPGGDSA